jgi:hypothetical protein
VKVRRLQAVVDTSLLCAVRGRARSSNPSSTDGIGILQRTSPRLRVCQREFRAHAGSESRHFDWPLRRTKIRTTHLIRFDSIISSVRVRRGVNSLFGRDAVPFCSHDDTMTRNTHHTQINLLTTLYLLARYTICVVAFNTVFTSERSNA